MKKLLLILLSLVFVSIVYAAIDTLEGTATSGMSKWEGQTVASGGASCSGNYGFETEAAFQNSTAGDIFALRVPVSCGGSVSSISAFLRFVANTSSEIEFAVYSDDGSGTDPDSLLGNYGALYDAGSGAASKWVVDSTISETISGTPTYIWVAIMFENDSSQYDYDSGGSYPTREYEGTWGTWPSTWPTGSDTAGTKDYRIYITF